MHVIGRPMAHFPLLFLKALMAYAYARGPLSRARQAELMEFLEAYPSVYGKLPSSHLSATNQRKFKLGRRIRKK